MFEDMFPSLGDYDFNDFVLGYRVQIPFRSGRRGKSVIDEAIQFGIELRAMGGSFPYAPCVRLKDLKAADVDEIEVVQRFNTSVETVVWSVGPDGEVIMDFRNWLRQLQSLPVAPSLIRTKNILLRNFRN